MSVHQQPLDLGIPLPPILTTGNLDTTTARQVLELIREMHSGGTTLILVTHDAELAAAADRRVEVRDGRVVHERQS